MGTRFVLSSGTSSLRYGSELGLSSQGSTALSSRRGHARADLGTAPSHHRYQDFLFFCTGLLKIVLELFASKDLRMILLRIVISPVCTFGERGFV